MCTTNVSPTAVTRSPVASISIPELSMATWPWGSVSTPKTAAGSATMARVDLEPLGLSAAATAPARRRRSAAGPRPGPRDRCRARRRPSPSPSACERDSSRPAHRARSVPWTATGWALAITPAAHPARSRSSHGRDDLGDQPDLQRPLGGHALLAAEEGQAHQVAEGHAPGHLQRLEGGGHVEGEVGVEEGGVLGGDDEVDLAEHVEGAAAGDAVDGRDHRLPQVVALRPEVLAGVVEHERRGPRARCGRPRGRRRPARRHAAPGARRRWPRCGRSRCRRPCRRPR